VIEGENTVIGKFIKFIKYAFAGILLALLIVGLITSNGTRSEVKNITDQLDNLTVDIINTIGKSPSVESIKKAQQVFDERKNSIKDKIKSLKDAGMLRDYTAEEDCSEPNRCSETALKIDACFRRNHNRIASINNDFLNAWNTDVDKSNELIQKFRNTSSQKEKIRLTTEINNINEKIEANIVLIDELALLIKDFAAITNFKEN